MENTVSKQICSSGVCQPKNVSGKLLMLTLHAGCKAKGLKADVACHLPNWQDCMCLT